MYYRDPNNEIHFLEDDNFKHLLPENSVLITNEEAEVLRNNAPSKTPIDPMDEARVYLHLTDWYVTRLTETGKAIPEDVVQKRKEAREKITVPFTL
jgi:hypothetical protein